MGANTATVTVSALSPCIGAEITGADLRSPNSAQTEAIRAALVEHQVVFFTDQPELTPTEQIEFARQFGDLHIHPAAPTTTSQPELFVIHAHKDSKVANGNGWHTDVSCDVEPPMATMLQLHKLPPSGGDTLFTSTSAAYESLSPALQAFLQTLTARHESEHIYRGRYQAKGAQDTTTEYPSAVHPVVRTHPESKRLSLFVNPSFTTRINELTQDESTALLSYLHQHQQRPEFQVRFRWTKNAIAFWDNRSAQHFALWDYWPNERKGHRVTIKGDAPYLDTHASTSSQGLTKLARRL